MHTAYFSRRVRAAIAWSPLVVAGALIFALSAWAAEKKASPVVTKTAVVPPAPAKEKSPGESPAESAIRAAEKAFVQAFNRGDAKAVAALWTIDGSLVTGQGRVLKGRQAIEDEYAAFFKDHPGQKSRSKSSPSNCPSRARPSRTAWPGWCPTTAYRRAPAATRP